MPIITKCPLTNQCTKEVTQPLPKPTCPQQCPKFSICNAPICPLDEEWHKRSHISGDKCCVYLLEVGKVDSKRIFAGAGLSKVLEVIEVIKENVLSSHAPIKRAYLRAETSPSRMKPRFSRVNESCA